MRRFSYNDFIEVDISGIDEINKMLAQFEDPQLTKRSLRATKKAAQVFAAPLRDAVRPLSKRMAASVYVHVAKREKPAYFVGHRRRIAFFWHMVIGGTREHSLTPRPGLGSQGGKGRTSTRSVWPTVRGVPAHPVVEAVARAYGNAAYAAFLADISKDA